MRYQTKQLHMSRCAFHRGAGSVDIGVCDLGGDGGAGVRGSGADCPRALQGREGGRDAHHRSARRHLQCRVRTPVVRFTAYS